MLSGFDGRMEEGLQALPGMSKIGIEESHLDSRLHRRKEEFTSGLPRIPLASALVFRPPAMVNLKRATSADARPL